MKKTCDGCKALIESFGRLRCLLGCDIEIKSKKVLGGFIECAKPSEECPKPRTNKEYLRLVSEKVGCLK